MEGPRRPRPPPGAAMRNKIFPYEEGILYDDRYEVIRTIGEGAFGEVKIIVDRKVPKEPPIAIKYIPAKKAVIIGENACKEALMMQRAFKDGWSRNIVNYAGSSYDPDRKMYLIFMEFCEAGELFQHIVPDKGVASIGRAQHFFQQLMNAVEHLHARGIAHLDIKAENCFLKENGTLKLGDFGMSTIFRGSDGKERRLHTQNGSKDFQSPQVLEGDFRAEPADIWACGVLLVLMLTGTYPWHRATSDDAEYTAWKEKTVSVSTEAPWKRLEIQALSLVKDILTHDEEERIEIKRIRAHPWMESECLPLTAQPLPKKMQRIVLSQQPNPCFQTSFQEVASTSAEAASMGTSAEESHSCSSPRIKKARQNEAEDSSCNRSFAEKESISSSTAKKPSPPPKSFSQPANFGRNTGGTQRNINLLQGYRLSWLSRRMTRFCVNINEETCRKRLKGIFDQNGMQFVEKQNGEMVVRTNGDVIFVVNIYVLKPNMDYPVRVMVDIRRSRGDGLAFNRIYQTLLPYFEEMICEDGTDWLREVGLVQAKQS